MTRDKDSFAGTGMTAEGSGSHPQAARQAANTVAVCQLHGVEQVVLDEPRPDPALSMAMDACDEPAIWRQYHEAPDKPRFLRSLASLAGHYRTQQPHRHAASTLWHHALIAAPFLLPPERWSVALPAKADPKGASAIYAQLQQWLGYQQAVRILAEAIRYGDLCNWSPLLQLEFLQALTWRRSSCGRPEVRIAVNVPEDWPQLAFVVSSVERWNCVPQLPRASATGDPEWQLRTRLAARLGYVHQRPVQAAHVLPPLFFPEAVLAGLQLWIGQLVQRRLVSGWDIRFHCEDFVLAELIAMEDQARRVVVPVRQHQIEGGDCEELLQFLDETLGLPSHHTSPNA